MRSIYIKLIWKNYFVTNFSKQAKLNYHCHLIKIHLWETTEMPQLLYEYDTVVILKKNIPQKQKLQNDRYSSPISQ